MREFTNRQSGFLAALVFLGVAALIGTQTTIPAAVGSVATTEPAPMERLTISDFTEVAKKVTPAVVNITRRVEAMPMSKEFRGPSRDRRQWEEWMEKFFGAPIPPMPRGPEAPFGPMEGAGSGVIVSSEGYILTNNHVVEGATEVTVTLPDEREFTGKVMGTDPKTDLAIVKIEGKELPYLPWGDSAKLQVGEPVLAVGNPFGLTSTVTQGIVSALGRGRMGITEYEDFIQTDAAINPGNSGGALVNSKGELIGINTAIFSRTGGYQGIGFAVPTSMAKPVFDSLLKTGKVVRGYLGIGIQDVTQDLADAFELEEPNGAIVGDVKDGSPADQAGLKRGDVIVGYNGKPVEDPRALQRMVTRTPVGTETAMTVIRDGKKVELAVTVGEQPGEVRIAHSEHDQKDHALTGLAVKDLDLKTARELGLEDAKGVVVTGVDPASEAARAGLMAGDVIREINRKPVQSLRDFEQLASSLSEKKRALLLINRRGASLFVTVKI